jgi:hypothetical protein
MLKPRKHKKLWKAAESSISNNQKQPKKKQSFFQGGNSGLRDSSTPRDSAGLQGLRRYAESRSPGVPWRIWGDINFLPSIWWRGVATHWLPMRATSEKTSQALCRLTLSGRLPEAVDQMNPVLCIFSRLLIGMTKILFQDQGSYVEAGAKLLSFDNTRRERVKDLRTTRLLLSIITQYCDVLSSIRSWCEANLCLSSHLSQARGEISSEYSKSTQYDTKSVMFYRKLSGSDSSGRVVERNLA